MGALWQELFKLVGTDLTPNTSYHLETDDQIEGQQMVGGLSTELCDRVAESMDLVVAFERVLLQHHPPHVHWYVTFPCLVWL